MQETSTQNTNQPASTGLMIHPTSCFGITRHNVVIPLIVTHVEDFEDGCFQYTIELNHPEPTRYMIVQQKADFASKFITSDAPLCNEFSMIRETLDEARELATQNLVSERSRLERELEDTINKLNDVVASTKDLESLINN